MEAYSTSFVCPRCNSEIQASSDMIGQQAECPACGQHIIIPDNKDVPGNTDGDIDSEASQAMKSRTIRIELGDF